MAFGVNLTSIRRDTRILQKILALLGFTREPKTSIDFFPVASDGTPLFCQKAGVPTTNAEGDSAGKRGVICYDSTNEDVYIQSAWVNATTHTWTALT